MAPTLTCLALALVGVDLDGVDIDNFKAKSADGVAAAHWENVQNITVRNSPVIGSLSGIEVNNIFAPSKPN